MFSSKQITQLRIEHDYLCRVRNCTETFEEFLEGVREDIAVDRAQEAYIRRCEPED